MLSGRKSERDSLSENYRLADRFDLLMDISIRKQRLKPFFEFTVPNTSGNFPRRANQNNRSPQPIA